MSFSWCVWHWFTWNWTISIHVLRLRDVIWKDPLKWIIIIIIIILHPPGQQPQQRRRPCLKEEHQEHDQEQPWIAWHDSLRHRPCCIAVHFSSRGYSPQSVLFLDWWAALKCRTPFYSLVISLRHYKAFGMHSSIFAQDICVIESGNEKKKSSSDKRKSKLKQEEWPRLRVCWRSKVLHLSKRSVSKMMMKTMMKRMRITLLFSQMRMRPGYYPRWSQTMIVIFRAPPLLRYLMRLLQPHYQHQQWRHPVSRSRHVPMKMRRCQNRATTWDNDNEMRGFYSSCILLFDFRFQCKHQRLDGTRCNRLSVIDECKVQHYGPCIIGQTHRILSHL